MPGALGSHPQLWPTRGARAAYAIAVTDTHVLVEKPLNREILSELA